MTKLQQIIQDLILITGSSTLAFIIAIALTPWFTKQLIKFKLGKQIRENALSGEKSQIFHALHKAKQGTPTMGGLLIIGATIITILISIILKKFDIFTYSLWEREETYLPIFTLVSFGLLGAVDDILNVKGIGRTKGLSAKVKLISVTILSFAGGLWFYEKLGYNSISIPIPGINNIRVGLFYIPIFMTVITATSNAVNFTDGLDGLASGLLIMTFGAFGIIAYASNLLILAALCGVLVGAILAFLWFNIPPAKFYMGDTGSLALGATLGVIAMLTGQTLILPIIGFIFVVETLSVIIQLTSKKFFGRKVFKIAPIHHHFEKCGWKEFTVVMRFWIVGGIMTTFGTLLGLINILS